LALGDGTAVDQNLLVFRVVLRTRNMLLLISVLCALFSLFLCFRFLLAVLWFGRLAWLLVLVFVSLCCETFWL
jgi:hypothetical protein